MFVANFLGGPERGSQYKEPINVKIGLTQFVLFYIMDNVYFNQIVVITIPNFT